MSIIRLIRKNFFYKSVHNDIRTYLDVLKKIGLKHIHYGYWLGENDDFYTAQYNLYKLLKEYIPHNTKNIIDVGGGVGGTSKLLLNDGYNPLCVIPDYKLIEYGKEVNEGVDFLLATAENFKVDKKFDLAVLIESYQYFTNHYKALANIVNNLSDHGRIIILDEFESESEHMVFRPTTLIKYLDENGYRLIENKDISDNILPTCDFLVNYFNNYDNTAMFKQWARTKNIYLKNDRNYLLLVFDRK